MKTILGISFSIIALSLMLMMPACGMKSDEERALDEFNNMRNALQPTHNGIEQKNEDLANEIRVRAGGKPKKRGWGSMRE